MYIPKHDDGESILPNRLYDTKTTAELLHVTRRTLERWRSDGRGPKTIRLHPRGRPLYWGQDLLTAIEAGRSLGDGGWGAQ